MTTEIWITVAIFIGTAFGLFLFFLILSSKKIDTLKKKTTPEPAQVVYGPKLPDESPDSDRSATKKSRGFKDIALPLILKTIVGFYDTVYIGDSYSCKVFIFNTAKNAERSEDLIKNIMMKDQEKKLETDTIYAKEQEPVKLKVLFFAPNFTISPESRIVEVPAGEVVTSTHLIAPINKETIVIGKRQKILVSFE